MIYLISPARLQDKSKLSSQVRAQESVIQGLRMERKLWSEELAQQGIVSRFPCCQIPISIFRCMLENCLSLACLSEC